MEHIPSRLNIAMAGLALAVLACFPTAAAQPFQWSSAYGIPALGGEIVEGKLGSEAAVGFNPFVLPGAGWRDFLQAPPLVYRDWAGDRSFRGSDGSLNLMFAADIEEVERDRDFIITLREGWRWSDGVEITAADFVETTLLLRDREIAAGAINCAYLDDEPIEIHELGRYRFRLTLPRPIVNGIASGACAPAPMHVVGPVYAEGGAAAVNALWGEEADPSEIVSAGPFVVSEIRTGERYAFTRNPYFGDMVQAADGTPLPAVDRWLIRIAPDSTQLSALAIAGDLDIYDYFGLDQLRALRARIDEGSLPGRIVSGGADDSVDFVTYNFNSTDPCKRAMFRQVAFRRAVSLLIDRDALVEAATSGLGRPARMWRAEGLRPFHAPELPVLKYDPERALELLAGIGFTGRGTDGVLVNQDTGCRAEFDLLWNSGNTRRGTQAQVISHMAAGYGVAIHPRQVETSLWSSAIVGTGLPRNVDSDAVLWGIAGGDIDNPAGTYLFGVGANLNAWNKSEVDVAPWELLLEQLTRRMAGALRLDERIEIFEKREALLREWLPLTPLISQGYYVYLNVGNTLPAEELDTFFLKYAGPGNFVELLEATR